MAKGEGIFLRDRNYAIPSMKSGFKRCQPQADVEEGRREGDAKIAVCFVAARKQWQSVCISSRYLFIY